MNVSSHGGDRRSSARHGKRSAKLKDFIGVRFDTETMAEIDAMARKAKEAVGYEPSRAAVVRMIVGHWLRSEPGTSWRGT